MGPSPTKGPNGYPAWTCPKCGEVCEGVGPVTLTIARICHERDKHGGPDILGHPVIRPLVPKREEPVVEEVMTQHELFENEPWRCTCCKELMYNLKDGKPAEGAPRPHWYSTEHPRLCSLCYSLILQLIGKDYWSKIQEEDRKADQARRERNKKLGPGGNYFPGDGA